MALLFKAMQCQQHLHPVSGKIRIVQNTGLIGEAKDVGIVQDAAG